MEVYYCACSRGSRGVPGAECTDEALKELVRLKNESTAASLSLGRDEFPLVLLSTGCQMACNVGNHEQNDLSVFQKKAQVRVESLLHLLICKSFMEDFSFNITSSTNSYKIHD